MKTTSKIFHALLVATLMVWFAPVLASDDCVGDCSVGPYDKGKGNHGHNRVAEHQHEALPIGTHEHDADIHQHIPEAQARSGWYLGGALGAATSDSTASVDSGNSEAAIFTATASTVDRERPDWESGNPHHDHEDGGAGTDGADGADGADGTNGSDGQDGAPGRDGTNGSDGQDGADGADGLNGANGRDGRDGRDASVGDDFNDGDNNSVAFRIYAGHDRLIDAADWLNIGLELGYQNLGSLSRFSTIDAVDLTVTGWIPITETWNFVARGGAAYYDSGIDDDTVGTFALGITKDFGNVRARLEGQQFMDADRDEDVNVVWLGAGYQF